MLPKQLRWLNAILTPLLLFLLSIPIQAENLRNISTRCHIQDGQKQAIAGFVIEGSQPKKVLIRGIRSAAEPATSNFDPELVLMQLVNGQWQQKAHNDNWQNSAWRAEFNALPANQVPGHTLDAAIIITLEPGIYTALANPKVGSGIGVVGVDDLDNFALTDSRLTNISGRCSVETGLGQSIAGFIIEGNQAKKVLLRGIRSAAEPTSSHFDPEMTLMQLINGQWQEVTNNDNWQNSSWACEFDGLAENLVPKHEKDAAIVMTLEPGVYTALAQTKTDFGIGVVGVDALSSKNSSDSCKEIKIDEQTVGASDFTDVESATRGAEYISNPIFITGLTNSVSANLSGGVGELIVNGRYVGSSTTVSNGDQVAIQANAPNTLSEQRLVLSYGNQTVDWTIKSASVAAAPTVTGSMAGATQISCEVNESGAATCSLPITVPSGTGQVQPQLSLSYSSQGRNGPLGLGWMLDGLSVISRCAATKAQDGFIDSLDFDDNDRFCLNGERLMLNTGQYGADQSVYLTEQNSFQKIVASGQAGSGPASFSVWNKDGWLMEFGVTNDSRIEAQGREDVLIWALNKVMDTKGNYYTVYYEEDTAKGEYLPKRIDYTGNAAANLNTFASVQFFYEKRPDSAPAYVGGSLVQSTQRLKEIKTYAGADLFRNYSLIYKIGELSQRSKLVSVQECGTDGSCFNPTTFAWAKEEASFDTPQLSLAHGAAAGGHVYSWNGVYERYVDFNNDGFIDRLWIPHDKEDWWITFGSDSGFQSPQMLIQQTANTPKLRSSHGRHQRFIDVNKDSLPDLVLYPYQGGTGLYVMYSDGQTLKEPELWLANGTSGVNLWSHEGRYETYLDLNKDGYPDKVWVPSGKNDLWVAYGTGSSFNAPQMLLAANVANGKTPYSGNG